MPNIRLSLPVLLGLLSCAILACLPRNAAGQSSSTEWVNDLRLGGYVIVFRHGATVSDQSTTDSMSRKPVVGERQLNAEGRAQAKAIGEAIRKLNIPVVQVLTSTVQRAVDTATLLAVGEVTAIPDLAEAAPELSADEKERRAAEFRKLVAKRPPADNNIVIVSHKPNIVDAFGKDWSDVREGEASVFEPDGHGGYRLVVRVKGDAWSELARSAK
jgi:broad specificity phosphatase PhoE